MELGFGRILNKSPQCCHKCRSLVMQRIGMLGAPPIGQLTEEMLMLIDTIVILIYNLSEMQICMNEETIVSF